MFHCGKRIKELLKEKKLSQNELSDIANVHRMTVSRWVKGYKQLG